MFFAAIQFVNLSFFHQFHADLGQFILQGLDTVGFLYFKGFQPGKGGFVTNCRTYYDDGLRQVGAFLQVEYFAEDRFYFFLQIYTAIFELRGDTEICHDLGDHAIAL